MLYMQSDAGVRNAILEARTPESRKAVYALVRDADIFVENLRPQLAAREGYAAEDLAGVRPGIIYVRVKLNTVTGPWASWVGFDVSASAFTGLMTAEGSPEQPAAAGRSTWWLTSSAACWPRPACRRPSSAELRRGQLPRHVHARAGVSFEMSLGLNDKAQLLAIDELGPEHQIQRPNLVTRMTPFGEFTRLGSQVEMSKTPESWTDPILVPIGSSRPEWLPKS